MQPLTQLSEARRREANLREIRDSCLGRGIGLGVSFRMQTSQRTMCNRTSLLELAGGRSPVAVPRANRAVDCTAELAVSEPSKQSAPSWSSSPTSSMAASSLFYSSFASMSCASSSCRNKHGHRHNYVPILVKPNVPRILDSNMSEKHTNKNSTQNKQLA